MNTPADILSSFIEVAIDSGLVDTFQDVRFHYEPAPITIAITPPTTTSVDMTIRGVICAMSRKNILERNIAISGLSEERGPTIVTGAYQSAE